MKLTIDRQKFVGALEQVSHGVAKASTLPALSYVLMEAERVEGEAGSVRFSTTNLDLVVRVTVAADVEVAGAAAVPHSIVADVVKAVEKGSEEIVLEWSEADYMLRITFANDNGQAQVKGIDPLEFPMLPPMPQPKSGIEMATADLAALLERTTFCAATDLARPVLTGILLTLNRESLQLEGASTDGFRLSVMSTPVRTVPDLGALPPVSLKDVPNLRITDKVKASLAEAGIKTAEDVVAAGAEKLKELDGLGEKTAAALVGACEQLKARRIDDRMIAPAASLNVLLKLVKVMPETVIVHMGDRFILDAGNVQLFTSAIEGNFPDFHPVLPRTHKTSIRVLREAFTTALKLVEAMAKHGGRAATLDVKVAEGVIILRGESSDTGASQRRLSVMAEGDDMHMMISTAFLKEVFSVADGDWLRIQLNQPNEPMDVRLVENEGFRHIVMPMSQGK